MSAVTVFPEPARWRREVAAQQQPGVTVSAVVAAELAAHGLSQSDLAALLDLSPATVSHRMTGRLSWQVRDLLALDLLFDQPRGWHLANGLVLGAAV